MEKYISLIVSAITLIFVICTFVRNGNENSKKEIKEESNNFTSLQKSIITANVKLDTINATVTETRTDIKTMDQKLQDIDKRVYAVERDLKTAFHEIECIKEGKNND